MNVGHTLRRCFAGAGEATDPSPAPITMKRFTCVAAMFIVAVCITFLSQAPFISIAAGQMSASDSLTTAPDPSASDDETADILRLIVLPRTVQARNGAPVEVDITFEWKRQSLHEGVLELEFFRFSELLYRYISPPLTLKFGLQTIRVMLPAMPAPMYSGQADVAVYFRTQRGRLDLGMTSLPAPTLGRRSMSVGLVLGSNSPHWLTSPAESADSDAASSPLENGDATDSTDADADSATDAMSQTVLSVLADHLNLGVYRPELLRAGSITAFTSRHPPESLSTHPLWYMQFDVLVLIDRGFSDLTPRQLAAIEAWVRAGGSLCIIPEGPVSSAHFAALNRLTTGTSLEAAFVPDALRRVVIAQTAISADINTNENAKANAVTNDDSAGASERRSATDAFSMFHADLGAVAIGHDVAAALATRDRDVWAPVAAHLWRVRADQARQMIERGRWSLKKVQRILDRQIGTNQDQTGQSFPNEFTWEWEAFERDGIVDVDLGVIAVTNVEAINTHLVPASLKTLSPVVIAAVLLGFLLIIGPGEYVLLGMIRRRRWTWITFPLATLAVTAVMLHMTNRTMRNQAFRHSLLVYDYGRADVVRASTYELIFAAAAQEMETRLDNATLQPIDFDALNNPAAAAYRSTSETSLQFEGRPPAAYVARQRLPQWQPVYNRMLRFDSDAPSWSPPWGDVTLAHLTSSDRLTELGALLDPPGDRVGAVAMIHQGRTLRATLDRFAHQSLWPNQFWTELSARSSRGIFEVVYQVSPNGAGSFEDLAMMDITDPDAWLVMVGQLEGGDVILHRRLFRRDEFGAAGSQR